MKRKPKIKKTRYPITLGPNGEIQFFKGGGGSPPTPRDVVHEPEGVDSPDFPRANASGQGKPPGAVSLSTVEVLDCLSEGPIDGLTSGSYHKSGYVGETGYRLVKFKPYVSGTAAQIQSGWARSVYYNGVQVLSQAGYRNFQNVDVAHSKGEPAGENLILDSNSEDTLQIQRSLGERLRGPELKYKDSNYSADSMILKDGEDKLGRSVGLPKYYNITNKRCTAFVIVVRVSMLSETLMTGTTEAGAKIGKGDVKQTSVTYRIDHKPYYSDDTKNTDFFPTNSAGEVEQSPLTNVTSKTIRGKITDGYAQSTKITPNPTSFGSSNGFADVTEDPDFIGWRIAVYRETFDSFRGSLRNQTFVDSLTEIYEEKFCYPTTAFIRHKFRADTFGQVPARTHQIRGLRVKVPNNYNPIMRTYGGILGGTAAGLPPENEGDPLLDTTTTVWDGDWKRHAAGAEADKLKKEWTDNPAWIYYDIITNKRYGLGKYIGEERVDKWSMFKIAQYCDELVPNGHTAQDYDDLPGEDFGEPRFTANIYIANQDDAFSVINNIASVFRGLTFYSAGKLQATHDAPKEPTYLFNNSNVMDGDFVYSSSAKKARHSVCLVRYNDEANKYKPSIEYVEDIDSIKKYGIRVKDVTAFGTTTKNQAQRWGQWTLATERLETETCNFTAGIEGAYLQAGDIVATSDQNRGTYKDAATRRRGGRVLDLQISSGRNMDGQPNWTGRAVLDSSISGWLDGGSHYSIAEVGQKSQLNFSIVTPPAYGDPLTSDLSTSDLANLYSRKSAVQKLDFRKADAGVGTLASFVGESGWATNDLMADGSLSISDYDKTSIENHTIIHFTGLYHNGTNVLNDKDYNITGFTGLLYDRNGNKQLAPDGSNYSGFVESSPDNFLWAVEYTGAALQGHGGKPDRELWKVIGVEEKNNFKYAVQCISHDPFKFDFVDKKYEPLVGESIGTPNAPTFSSNPFTIAQLGSLTAKKVTVRWNKPSPDTNLAGYNIYIKRDVNFVDSTDFHEDIWGAHPNGVYFSRFVPDEGSAPFSYFIPFQNGTYYVRIYSVNKHGRSEGRNAHCSASVTIDGINLIEDVSVSALSLAGSTDLSDFTQQVSEAANYASSNLSNLPGNKDGWPYYHLENANIAWQAGFAGDPAELAGLSLPQDYTFRITFRKPSGPGNDFPDPLIHKEVTGQTPNDLNYSLSLLDNVGITLPANYDYPSVAGETVTPLRAMDVIVEAIDAAGNSSAGGQVAYDAGGNLTQDSSYAVNPAGYDILYIQNTPASGVRLTHRIAEGPGQDQENCLHANAANYCTDQWLNADGTLNFILKKDTPGRVTGQADITNAAFLISRSHFTTAEIPTMLQNGLIDDDGSLGGDNSAELKSPYRLNLSNETYLIMGQGFTSSIDNALTVSTPFQNIQSESTVGNVGAFTHLYMGVAFVDHFLEQVVKQKPTKKDVVKKLLWGDEFSDNVVKIGARNAFLAGSLSWRAWAVVNVNWDCATDLAYHLGGFDTITLVDYAGDYQMRRAWSTGGKSPETKYNFTTIQAYRQARKFTFTTPQPTDQYEIVVWFSATPKWRTATDRIPVYGSDSSLSPNMQILTKDGVLQKETTHFTLKDSALGGFGQGSRPVQGNLFVGILLGSPFPPGGENLGGFGQLSSDPVFDYNFDTWDTTKATKYGQDQGVSTYNLS
jgi:hypothetical protein